MTTTDRVSVREIRAYHNQQEKAEADRKELFCYYIIRPISFYPTALFINLGISANQTTWISVVVLLVGCVLLATGSYIAGLAGTGLALVWLILDHVDGNIARFLRTPSPYGEFLDALGASVAHLIFLAAGIGFFVRPDSMLISSAAVQSAAYPGWILIAGAWASLTAIWIRMVYHKFRNTFPTISLEKHDFLGTGKKSSLSVLLEIGNNLFNLSGVLLPFLLLSIVIGIVDLFLILTALSNTALLAISLRRIIRAGSQYSRGEQA